MKKTKRLSRKEECEKCRLRESRKPIILKPGERRLFLPLSPDSHYEHMLMPQHVGPVSALLSKLEQFNYVSYLNGGVVEHALFTGSKGYTDIDVLTVYDDSRDSGDKFMALVDGACRPKPGYKVMADSEGYVTINGQGFKIETDRAKDAYMMVYEGPRRTARFTPLRTLEQIRELPAGDGTKGIHLTVIGHSTFRKNFVF